MTEYRIDELARRAGTTVRNVRAYQERGLIPPPRRVGRVGLYADAHLARLGIIGQLLVRGYTLANIAELIAAWERGHEVDHVLGLDAEVPTYLSLDELRQLFADHLDADTVPAALREAVAIGMLEPDGDRFRVASPRLLHAAVELIAAGVPHAALFEHATVLRRDVEQMARRFVDLVETHVFGAYDGQMPPAEDLPRLADVAQRIRPLADMVVTAELARAIEQEATQRLAAHLDQLVDTESTAVALTS